MQGEQLTVYPLRLSVGQVVRMVGVVLVMIGLSITAALINRRGVSLLGLVTLSPEQARWMFWGFAAFFGLAYLPLALATAWKGLFAKQRVEFAESGVWLPQSVWSSRHALVPFAEIHGAKVIRRGKQRLLEIALPGRRFWIGETWLPSPAVLDEILALFQVGVGAASTGHAGKGAVPDRGRRLD